MCSPNAHKAVGTGDAGERRLSLGFEARRSTPAELSAIMRNDVAKWAGVAKAAGIYARWLKPRRLPGTS